MCKQYNILLFRRSSKFRSVLATIARRDRLSGLCLLGNPAVESCRSTAGKEPGSSEFPSKILEVLRNDQSISKAASAETPSSAWIMLKTSSLAWSSLPPSRLPQICHGLRSCLTWTHCFHEVVSQTAKNIHIQLREALRDMFKQMECFNTRGSDGGASCSVNFKQSNHQIKEHCFEPQDIWSITNCYNIKLYIIKIHIILVSWI